MYLIRERFFRLGEDSDITDEQGRPVLHVDGKVLSLRNRLVLRDPQGREVAQVQVQRKLIAMRPTYQITVGGQEAAEVRKRLFTPFGDRFTIDVPGPDDLEMRGDLFDHEFSIERGGQTVATVSKRWFSMRDTYAVDVAARPGRPAAPGQRAGTGLGGGPGAGPTLSPSLQPTTGVGRMTGHTAGPGGWGTRGEHSDGWWADGLVQRRSAHDQRVNAYLGRRRTDNFDPDGQARPGKTRFRTAVPGGSMLRMRLVLRWCPK
jgi:uncharacterized protein YxjI